jgi:hypothetical protein
MPNPMLPDIREQILAYEPRVSRHGIRGSTCDPLLCLDSVDPASDQV